MFNLKRRPWLAASGVFLLLVAAFWSGSQIERTFGRTPHSLSWGPALFRALLALHGLILLAAGGFRGQSPSPGVEGANTAIKSRRASRLILAAIVGVAILLRIPSLDSSLWLDEVLTMAHFARPPFATIFTSFPDQNQHMLYSLLAHAALRLFGEHAWALRLPSVALGAASIWALFLLGRRIVGEKQALLACALMAVSYHHIWFSQNARGYMGLLFFSNLATWLWLEAMERDDMRKWLWYAVVVSLGFWIHMTMLFVCAAHALIFLVAWLRSERNGTRLGHAAFAFVLCGTLVTQLHALALPEFLRTAVGEFSPASEWTNPLWVLTESMRSLRVGFAGTAVVLCGLVLVFSGWLDILRRDPRAGWAMVLPALMGGGSMLALGHNLWPRFFFFCMGFALLIAIHGAMRLPELLFGRLRGGAMLAARTGYALAGLIILASITTIPRAWAPKQDFTAARDYVEKERGTGDAVIAVGLAALAYSDYYAPSWEVAKTGGDLAALRAKSPRVFLVYTLPVDLRAAHPDIWKAVQSDFETIKVFPGTLGGGDVYVCRNRGSVALSREPRN
jgi:mannosyltransferase